MEAANRWETEAIRESRDRRRARPTVSQQRTTPSPDGDWRTLREASDETGIPLGTLRKWCRRESVDSYLESDGEQTLRMLEMGSVDRHAKAMGRELSSSPQTTDDRQQPDIVPPSRPVLSTQYSVPSTADEVGTMIVPVDAWNKMLTQLGNLHEAGQQLAEARERAGKAETEAKFLRERLTEMRQSDKPQATSRKLEEGPRTTGHRQQAEESGQTTDNRQQPDESVPPPFSSSPSASSSSHSGGGAKRSEAEGVKEGYRPPGTGHQPDENHQSEPVLSTEYSVPGTAAEGGAGGQPSAETTSFWRYVVRGWRGRRR